VTGLSTEIKKFMRGLKKRNAHEAEFHQAVEEVVTSVMPWYLDHERYRQAQILERLTEPDRISIPRAARSAAVPCALKRPGTGASISATTCSNITISRLRARELRSAAVATSRYAAEKALHKNARVISLSDSDGFVEIKDGLTPEQLQFVHRLKEVDRGRISEMAEKFDNVTFHADASPWGLPCDIAMPCATQNELDGDAARQLIKNGVLAVCEGANMPTTAEAATLFRENRILHAPGKASNAGGVAVSGLEQSQNSMRLSWSHEEVDQRLQEIMRQIHDRCVKHGSQDGRVNYVDGANIAGFKKVADALLGYGVV
jgi:glutamate dehydrogenase/leucine dehydrogenase